MTFRKYLSTVLLIAVAFCAHAQTLIEKADKQYELHAYRLAAQSYEYILNRDADEWGASARLADCYFHLNELDNAAKWYSRAVEGGNIKPETRLNYGKVLMMQGRYEEAENQFRAYRNIDAGVANHFIKSVEYARENDDNRSEMSISALSKVNTAFSDYGVTLFRDNLIWSSSRNDMQRKMSNGTTKDWTGASNNQLYKAPIENISTAAFKIDFLKSDLKNNYNESNPSYSADGKTVAFMRNNFGDGERITSDGGTEMSIFLASVDAMGNWRDVKPFPHNAGSTGFPALSPDGKTLYFTSNRPGGQGGFDIYVSQLRGSLWSEPRNLGSVVNSKGDEITPYFDGQTLYFSSDWHNGYGGYDIFKSNDAGKTIESLGTGINSSYDDFGFVYDPSVKTGFFVSNRKGGKGKEDIYRTERQFESVNLVVLENGKPVKDAKITVKTGTAAHVSQLKSGNWLVDLSDRKTYELEVKKEGFKAKTIKIEPNYTSGNRLMEVSLQRDVPTEMSAIPEFKGSVIDASTNQPLEGVLVKATSQTGQIRTESTYTDKAGKYSFPLSINMSYLVTYSKEGFVNFNKTIRSNELKNRNIGETVLKPSALTDKDELIAETRAVQPMPRPKDVPSSYDIKSKGPTVKGAVQGYAVQIFVSTSDDVLNLSKYDDLRSLGNLYIVPEGDKQKVRLGVFSKKEEANTASKKAQEMGYKGVFVIDEYSAKAAANNAYSPIPKPKLAANKTEEKSLPQPIKTTATPPSPPKTPKTAEVPKENKAVVTPKTTEVAPPPVKEDKTFKVQIAAMKKPEWFDDSKVSQLWKVDEMRIGNLTYFIMDGIKTLQQAKDLKAKVKAAGYKDAKVVVKDADKFKVVD